LLPSAAGCTVGVERPDELATVSVFAAIFDLALAGMQQKQPKSFMLDVKRFLDFTTIVFLFVCGNIV
jgi:hypothetical protein